MGKLDGKIALITGGTSGIGLATAKRFVNEGAYVYITGRRDPELTAAVKEIGRHSTGVRGDVSALADLDRLFTQIAGDKGKLDVVFANAGVAKYASLDTITEEFFDAIFDVLRPSQKQAGISDAAVEGLIAERAQSKKGRNFARADQIRQQLLEAGIILEDTKEGIRWKRK